MTDEPLSLAPPTLGLIDLPRRDGEPQPVNPPVTLLTVERLQCRWPVSRTRQGDMRVCGRPSHNGSSWCYAHYCRAFDVGRRLR